MANPNYCQKSDHEERGCYGCIRFLWQELLRVEEERQSKSVSFGPSGLKPLVTATKKSRKMPEGELTDCKLHINVSVVWDKDACSQCPLCEAQKERALVRRTYAKFLSDILKLLMKEAPHLIPSITPIPIVDV